MAWLSSPFAAGRAPMRLDRRRVDEDLGRWASGRGERVEDPNPHALRRPAHEPIVERLVRTIDLRRIDPAATGLQDVDDARDDPSVIDPRLASRVGRKQRLEAGKLLRRQPEMVAIHLKFPFEDRESHPPSRGNLIYGSWA